MVLGMCIFPESLVILCEWDQGKFNAAKKTDIANPPYTILIFPISIFLL